MSNSRTVVGVAGPLAGSVFSLDAGVLTIGRNPDAGIPIVQDSGVSRNHAQFYMQGDQTFIVDLGSSNGTLANGIRLSGPMQLLNGDVIAIGQNVFKVQLPTPSTSPTGSTSVKGNCPNCGGIHTMSQSPVNRSGTSGMNACVHCGHSQLAQPGKQVNINIQGWPQKTLTPRDRKLTIIFAILFGIAFIYLSVVTSGGGPR